MKYKRSVPFKRSRTHGRSKSLCSKPTHCHLCGLPIPSEIVNVDHPLFGTVDHVTPLSKGGLNVIENRAPAHKLCNNKKASRLVLDPQEVLDLQARQAVELRRMGFSINKVKLNGARQRIGFRLPMTIRLDRASIMRWEDDGGLSF